MRDLYEDVALVQADLSEPLLRVARAAVVVTLPPWANGLELDLLNDASADVAIKTSGMDQIKLLSDVGTQATGGDGSSIRLIATNRRGVWIAERFSGEWDVV